MAAIARSETLFPDGFGVTLVPVTLVGVMSVAINEVIHVLARVIYGLMTATWTMRVIRLAPVDLVVLGRVEDAHHQDSTARRRCW